MYPEKSLWKLPSKYGNTGQKPISSKSAQVRRRAEVPLRTWSCHCLGLSQVRMGRNIKPVIPKANKNKHIHTKAHKKTPNPTTNNNKKNPPKLFLQNLEVTNSKPKGSLKLSY